MRRSSPGLQAESHQISQSIHQSQYFSHHTAFGFTYGLIPLSVAVDFNDAAINHGI